MSVVRLERGFSEKESLNYSSKKQQNPSLRRQNSCKLTQENADTALKLFKAPNQKRSLKAQPKSKTFSSFLRKK
jgi:hypothetical protein